MKRMILVILSGLLLVSGCASFFNEDLPEIMEGIPEDYSSSEYRSGEIIISLDSSRPPHDNTAQSMAQEISEQARILELHGFNSQALITGEPEVSQSSINESLRGEVVARTGFLHLAEYSTDDFSSLDEASAAIREALMDEGYGINFAIPNYKVRAGSMVAAQEMQPEVEMHDQQAWHYEMINAPAAWEWERGCASVRVAVLDTGIDYHHPNLKELVNENLGVSFVDEPLNDNHGHGTHVAGIIASYGEVTGVMQEATLIPVKVLDKDGEGDIADIIEAVVYAAERGADVINMSLGGLIPREGTEEFRECVNELLELVQAAGSLVVAASGNDNQLIETGDYVSFPASFSPVLTVGALDRTQQRALEEGWGSNYGESLDVMAPGTGIYSTVPADILGEDYAYLSGTSMAAPHVAGIAGLVRSLDSEMTASDLKSLIKSSSHNLGNSFYYGEGVVDSYQSIGGRITGPYF